MSDFKIGRADDADDAERPLHAALLAGAVGLDGNPAIEIPPALTGSEIARLVEELNPAAMISTRMAMFCTCGCNAIDSGVDFNFAVGWTAVAALVGQLNVYIESLPVHLRDQARAMSVEQAAEVRKAMGWSPR